MESLQSLTDKKKYQVYGECLACLAYFAIETKRCSRSDAETALANSTRLKETPTLEKRLSWWNAKLSNIQWAFREQGLEGTAIHGATLPAKKAAGEKGNAAHRLESRRLRYRYFLAICRNAKLWQEGICHPDRFFRR